ncbi:hypothetical protein BC943DRAFT_318576 [Umbelopsis sp. AD052]|nr:hypothetical protein BC943DRAFT_318576 [Umbelopsis sp. AD052]
MNRGPIVLTIDEAEYLLDQLPPPSKDDDAMVTKVTASRLYQSSNVIIMNYTKGYPRKSSEKN